MKKFTASIEGYDICEKKVGKTGNSGSVYVPSSWIGKRAKAVLLEPLDEDKKD